MLVRSFQTAPSWIEEAVASVSTAARASEQPAGTMNCPSTRTLNASIGVAVLVAGTFGPPTGRQPVAMTVVAAPQVTRVAAVSVYFPRPLWLFTLREAVEGAAFGAVTCAQIDGAWTAAVPSR